MNFVDVGGQSFGTGCFIVAQDAEIGFDVGVEVTFEAPIVHSSPGAIGASVQLFLLLFFSSARRLRRLTRRRTVLLLTRRCGDCVSRSD